MKKTLMIKNYWIFREFDVKGNSSSNPPTQQIAVQIEYTFLYADFIVQFYSTSYL